MSSNDDKVKLYKVPPKPLRTEKELKRTLEECSKLDYRQSLRENQNYIINPIWPTGQIHLIAGSSGTGKTSWTLPTLYKIMQEQEVFGYKTKYVPFLYFSCDRNIAEIDEILVRLGMKDIKLPIDSIFDLSVRDDVDEREFGIRDLCKIYPWVRFFFIEAISQFLVPTEKEKNLSAYAANLIMWRDVKVYCMENDITIVGTTHCPKAKFNEKYQNPRDRVIGSVAQAAVASTIMIFDTEDEKDIKENRRVVHILPRNNINRSVRLRLDSKGEPIFEGEYQNEESLEVDDSSSKVDMYIINNYNIGEEFNSTDFKNSYMNDIKEIINPNVWTKLFNKKENEGIIKKKSSGTRNGNKYIIIKMPKCTPLQSVKNP